jgi:hypothetical protein
VSVAERLLTDTPFRVRPDLVGRPLGSPRRRLVALALDIALLIVPTLAVALGGGVLALRLTDPEGLRALWTVSTKWDLDPAARGEALGHVARLFARYEMPGTPAEAVVAVERGDRAAAAAALEDCDLVYSLSLFGERPEMERPEGAVSVEVERFIPRPLRGIVLLAVPGLYFTLLTAGTRGRTVGKRLLGLEVVRLDGERLSLLDSLERFGGYFGIAGTAGIGALDLWRDPNRRPFHDRAAGTVVLRVRRA